jgi:hypothetical protein
MSDHQSLSLPESHKNREIVTWKPLLPVMRYPISGCRLYHVHGHASHTDDFIGCDVTITNLFMAIS